MSDVRTKKGYATALDKTIGDNLKKLRLSKDMSQSDIADIAKVTFQQLQKYERGTNRIAASKLATIANGLNVDVKVFYDGLLDEGKQNLSFEKLGSDKLELLHLLDDIDDPQAIKSLIKFLKGIKN